MAIIHKEENMRVTAEQQHNAGAKLQSIADDFREMNPYLDKRLALKLAMMANPNLAEKYLGYAVRHDARNEVLRILIHYRAPQ